MKNNVPYTIEEAAPGTQKTLGQDEQEAWNILHESNWLQVFRTIGVSGYGGQMPLNDYLY